MGLSTVLAEMSLVASLTMFSTLLPMLFSTAFLLAFSLVLVYFWMRLT